MDLYNGVLSGDKRAIARLITLVENRDLDGMEIYERLYKKTGNARIVGITGPPGAGKSTLLGILCEKFLSDGFKVGIVAVDPTSPYSGGAVLGDRIRMGSISGSKNCFVRSMASRGQLGGISRGALDAVNILDASGFDYIFIETVGTGQSEIDIARYSDIVILVLVPGLGDDIQAFKAGIMEIGDIIAINKSDYFEAQNTYSYINSMLSLKDGKRPEIILTSSMEGSGIDKLKESLVKLISSSVKKSEIGKRRKELYSYELKQRLMEILIKTLNQEDIDRVVEEVEKRNITPYKGAKLLIKNLCIGEWKNGL